jgi:hypothetical protein
MPTYKTEGIDWKVPIQLVVTLAVWALARYTGIDLSAQAEVIVGVIVGALVATRGPAPRTKPKTNGAAVVEPGGGAGV